MIPNLKTIAKQKRYRLTWDESREGREQDPWLMQLPARFGHIYPHGAGILGAACDSNRIVAKLLALPYTRCDQRGDDGANVLFPVAHLDAVASIMRVRRRRTVQFTDAQRAAARDRLAKMRNSVLRASSASQNASEAA